MADKFKNKVAISASRLDLYSDCSMRYAAKYIYKLPDSGNDGMRRGSVAHDIFEILGKNSRHKDTVNSVIQYGSCQQEKGLWRLIEKVARKYKVAEVDNLDLIDSFIYIGLKHDFFGPPGTIKVLIEKDFDFEVIEKGINYRLKGYIDVIYLVQEGETIYVECKDFKTSKLQFRGDKIDCNNQALIYQLAITRHILPEYKMRRFHFLFLKFPKKPIQEIDLYDEGSLSGFEQYLTNIQIQLNNFTKDQMYNNFAADNPAKRWLCGKEGYNKAGNIAYICPAQRPMDYFVIVKNGEIIDSAVNKDDLKPKDGETIENREYTGCKKFYDKNGRKISYQFDED